MAPDIASLFSLISPVFHFLPSLFSLCLSLPLGESLPRCGDAQSPATVRKQPEDCTESDALPYAGRCCGAALHRPRCRQAQDCASCGQGGAQGHGAIWAATG